MESVFLISAEVKIPIFKFLRNLLNLRYCCSIITKKRSLNRDAMRPEEVVLPDQSALQR